MKKFLLSSAASIMFVAMSYSQVSYGLRAGLNLAKVNVSNGEQSESTGSLTSFNVTGFFDTPVAPNVSVQPGISFQGKGGKNGEGANTLKSSLMYIEVPINAVYKISAGPGNGFIGLGPYLGYAISGKNKQGENSADIVFGDNGYKRFDAGINFLGGYRLNNGYLIHLGYGLGLINFNGNPNGNKLKNRVFSLGLGFQL